MRIATRTVVRGLIIGAVFGLAASAFAWGTIWFWPMLASFIACAVGAAVWMGPGTEPAPGQWPIAGASAWRGLVIGLTVWIAVIYVGFSRTTGMGMEEAVTGIVSSWLLMAVLCALLGAVVGLCAPWVRGGQRSAHR